MANAGLTDCDGRIPPLGTQLGAEDTVANSMAGRRRRCLRRAPARAMVPIDADPAL